MGSRPKEMPFFFKKAGKKGVPGGGRKKQMRFNEISLFKKGQGEKVGGGERTLPIPKKRGNKDSEERFDRGRKEDQFS